MEIEVVPEPEDDEREALLAALDPAAEEPSAAGGYASPWRQAALREAAEPWSP